MSHIKVRALSQLLGCYFHQDWPDEFNSDQAALQAIVESETHEQLQIGAGEIEALLRSNLSEEELRKILINAIGCYFEPNSRDTTYGQWLKEVRNEFIQK